MPKEIMHIDTVAPQNLRRAPEQNFKVDSLIDEESSEESARELAATSYSSQYISRKFYKNKNHRLTPDLVKALQDMLPENLPDVSELEDMPRAFITTIGPILPRHVRTTIPAVTCMHCKKYFRTVGKWLDHNRTEHTLDYRNGNVPCPFAGKRHKGKRIPSYFLHHFGERGVCTACWTVVGDRNKDFKTRHRTTCLNRKGKLIKFWDLRCHPAMKRALLAEQGIEQAPTKVQTPMATTSPSSDEEEEEDELVDEAPATITPYQRLSVAFTTSSVRSHMENSEESEEVDELEEVEEESDTELAPPGVGRNESSP